MSIGVSSEAALNKRSILWRHLANVVRCHGSRPIERIRASIASGGISWPCVAPAAGDALVHQRAAQIVGAGLQAGGGALRAIFTHEV